jgi:N6-adenosine-specific RNA methylase IME4
MFNTATMDPPWLERGAGKIKRGADRHYPLMSKEKIYATVYNSDEWTEVGEDAHLYLWVTNTFLKDGLWLMEQLAFRYITNIAWVKVTNNWPTVIMDSVKSDYLELIQETWLATLKGAVRIGIGQYFRGSHELCLFGVRGKCHKPAKALPGAFMAPRDEHSKKPQYIYELIEKTSPGPYVEFFARQSGRPNWTAWGNEV